MINVSTTIYQIAQSLILKSIFCCNTTFYKSPSSIKLLTKTILVNCILPKIKATFQWREGYPVTELCQISEELRFCFLKSYFDTQDFSHHNILTLFDSVDDEQFRVFFQICLEISHLQRALHKNKLLDSETVQTNYVPKVSCYKLQGKYISQSHVKTVPEKQEVHQLQVVQGKKEEKVSCSSSHHCKALLKFLYSNRNYPDPFMQLSSICRDTNTSKEGPVDLLQFFDTLFGEKLHSSHSELN